MISNYIEQLIECDITGWYLEEKRRDKNLSDSERLEYADQVSIFNFKRNENIDKINNFLKNIKTNNSNTKHIDTPQIFTCSIGDLIDRLVISKIRIQHIENNDTRYNIVTSEINDLKKQIDDILYLITNKQINSNIDRVFGFDKNKIY
jgi:hypothetical protein